MEKVNLEKECFLCKESVKVSLTEEESRKISEGKEKIQDIVPNMSPDLREIFISGICGKCFDKNIKEIEKRGNDSDMVELLFEDVENKEIKDNFVKESALDYLKQLSKLNKYLNGHKGYIAGGCFKNIFNDEDIKDIDVFFEKEEDFNDAYEMYMNYFRMGYAQVIYENSNAVCFKMNDDSVNIELIRSTFKSPLEMIDSFDFSIAKFALVKEKKFNDEGEHIDNEFNVIYHKDFFKHLMLKRVVITNDEIDFPLNTLERILRYKGYGYSPCRQTKVKIATAINKMTLPENVEDMFTGLYEGID